MKLHILIASIFLWISATAGDSITVARLLQRVVMMQPRDNAVFPAGSIPAYRKYHYNEWSKADPNPFYSGLVVMSLRYLMPQMNSEERQLAKKIIDDCMPSFAKFRNQKGRPTYNFYTTDTPRIFPNSGWMNWFNRRQQLPDDMDDTAIVWLALDASDSTARDVHRIMQSYTNRPSNQMNKGPKAYRDIGAYSTWFGIKMPVQFDACVLANVLYFVQKKQLKWTAADSASVHVLDKMIENEDHLRIPHEISPNYGTTPLILYHLSRLMSAGSIPSLEKHRALLIEQAREAIMHAPTFLDEVILGTALLRWGVEPPNTPPRTTNSFWDLVDDESEFSICSVTMMWMLPDGIRRAIGRLGLVTYYSKAFNNVLLVEHLLLRRQFIQKQTAYNAH